MKAFFVGDEGVEVRREEGPDGILVVKIAVAAGTEVDEVFEAIEIWHMDESTVLEVVELDRDQLVSVCGGRQR